MNPLESYGIDNPDYVASRMKEKAQEEERIEQSKKQIIDGLKYSQEHYHATYLMTMDWLKNYAKTGEEDCGVDNFKNDLEKIGVVDGKKIKLTEKIARDILENLISKREIKRLFDEK